MDKKLSRREREILDILLMAGEATAQEVRQALSDSPSYSTARAMLGRLETKGYVRHRQDGPRYVYAPVVSRARERKSAVERLVQVFYEGSFAKAVTGMVDASGNKLSEEELDAIERAVIEARQKRKRGPR